MTFEASSDGAAPDAVDRRSGGGPHGTRPGRSRVWLAALASLVLYGVVAGFTLHEIGLSPDTVSAWATDAPHRTVLCVPADASEGLQVAADPTTADRESVRAPLESSERSSSLGPLGLHLRPHTYRLTVSVFWVEFPWMKNDYTAGWTDLPAHLAWTVARSPRAGQAVHLVLGGLVVLVCCLFAGRLAGWPASLMAGVWLATDPWFLVYKRLVGGHEVVLQLLAVLAVSLLGAAYLRRRPALLYAAMFVCGLGLHVKPSFAAVVAGIAVGVGVAGSGVWRGRPGVGRTVAVAAL
ncbi:MAG: glycosyltransferase family 39 protein, partial [Deltaproteobacteria bacterium]|nr:glycosyltransferase family 39 protein [Deltaproteobacteria bacterium]